MIIESRHSIRHSFFYSSSLSLRLGAARYFTIALLFIVSIYYANADDDADDDAAAADSADGNSSMEENDAKESVCNSSDIVPFTAFFECCNIWTIFAPCTIAFFYGCLRVRTRWEQQKRDLVLHRLRTGSDSDDCQTLLVAYLRTVVTFFLGFTAVFIDLLAAAANFMVDGSNSARCFAVGSCFHTCGIIAAELKYDRDRVFHTAIVFVLLAQALELVSFLFINRITQYTAFVMIAGFGYFALVLIDTGTHPTYSPCMGEDLREVMFLNQSTLTVVVIVAFFSTLRGSFLLLLLPEVPVETITYLWDR